jgi:protein gp37
MPQTIKRPQKIFVADMGDLFYEGVSDDDILRVLDAAAAVPRHTYQFLTKRPERMAAFFATRWQEPIPGNWWLGISAGHQAYFDARWPFLASIPAAVRWVSYEPAIGPIDVSAAAVRPSWVVCGCDNASGRPGRPMDLAWARALLAQCQVLGVPVFMKQVAVEGTVCTTLEQFPADLQMQEFPGS